MTVAPLASPLHSDAGRHLHSRWQISHARRHQHRQHRSPRNTYRDVKGVGTFLSASSFSPTNLIPDGSDDPSSYEDQLAAKASSIRLLFGDDGGGDGDGYREDADFEDVCEDWRGRQGKNETDAEAPHPCLVPRERGLEIYPSPKTRGYRLRCRFAVVREVSSDAGEDLSFDSLKTGCGLASDSGRQLDATRPNSHGGALRYALFERGRVVVLDVDGDASCDGNRVDASTFTDTGAFPAASDAIAALMPRLLRRLNALTIPAQHDRDGSFEGSATACGDVERNGNAYPITSDRETDTMATGANVLVEGLSAIGFLASRTGDVVVTLWTSVGRSGGGGDGGVGHEGEQYGGAVRKSRDGGSSGSVQKKAAAAAANIAANASNAAADKDWDIAANSLIRELGLNGIVGRSKGRVRIASEGVDHVWETLAVHGDRSRLGPTRRGAVRDRGGGGDSAQGGGSVAESRGSNEDRAMKAEAGTGAGERGATVEQVTPDASAIASVAAPTISSAPSTISTSSATSASTPASGSTSASSATSASTSASGSTSTSSAISASTPTSGSTASIAANVAFTDAATTVAATNTTPRLLRYQQVV